LREISYKRQWQYDGIYSFNLYNDKLENLEEYRKTHIIKENYYLFQNYKDFNIIFNKKMFLSF
jgi:hypothetical protein